MGAYPTMPEMAQSGHVYGNGVKTELATSDLPMAHSRPTKPLPAARPSTSSSHSDDAAAAVYQDGHFTLDSSSRFEYSPSNYSAGTGTKLPHGSINLERAGSQHYRLQLAESTRITGNSPASLGPCPSQSDSCPASANCTTSTYDFKDYESENCENKAMQTLVYLSLLLPFLASSLCIYTTLMQLALVLISPLRFCTSGRTLRQQTIQYLAPPAQLQLRLIHSSFALVQPCEERYSARSLSLMHLLSPIVSVGVAVAAWVAAIFWFYAAILGDPDGKGGSNDGRATVLSVRGWWEAWLTRPIRQ